MYCKNELKLTLENFLPGKGKKACAAPTASLDAAVSDAGMGWLRLVGSLK